MRCSSFSLLSFVVDSILFSDTFPIVTEEREYWWWCFWSRMLIICSFVTTLECSPTLHCTFAWITFTISCGSLWWCTLCRYPSTSKSSSTPSLPIYLLKYVHPKNDIEDLRRPSVETWAFYQPLVLFLFSWVLSSPSCLPMSSSISYVCAICSHHQK